MTHEFVPDFTRCHTLEQLGSALGTSPDALRELASPDAETYYRRHAIPKRSPRRKGEVREVFEPKTEELKRLHRNINRRLSIFASSRDVNFPTVFCFGFVRGKSTLDNAKEHNGASLLLRADIENFFPSIRGSSVEAALRSLGIDQEPAMILGRVLCFKGFLVPGLSASPLVANLVCRDLDGRLGDIASQFSVRYTRYADDLSFSGDSLPPIATINHAVEAEGFHLSTKKIRTTKRGQAHFVTGLSISDSSRPHVPKRMKRRLRQELYYAQKYSIAEHLRRINQTFYAGLNRLDGSVRYVSYIERDTANDFSSRWSILLTRDDVSPTAGPDFDKQDKAYFAAIDETAFSVDGQTYIALGFALYDEPDAVDKGIRETLANYLADPYSSGKKSLIERKGLHFTDANPELQAAFILRLPTIPVRCLVAFTKVDGSVESFKNGYLRAIQWGMRQLCLRADRGRLTLLVEKSDIPEQEIAKAVADSYEAYKVMGLRRPLSEPELRLVGKEAVQVSVPDFMLAIFHRYLESNRGVSSDGQPLNKEQKNARRLTFERVRDRYNLICDMDNHRFYSRRNPLHSDSLEPKSTSAQSATNTRGQEKGISEGDAADQGVVRGTD